MLISIKILIMKIIMKLNKQMSFLYMIYIYDYVRGRATPGPYSARDGAFGWASGVARPRVACAIGGAVASHSTHSKNLPPQCASLLLTFSVSVDAPLTLSVQNT